MLRRGVGRWGRGFKEIFLVEVVSVFQIRDNLENSVLGKGKSTIEVRGLVFEREVVWMSEGSKKEAG